MTSHNKFERLVIMTISTQNHLDNGTKKTVSPEITGSLAVLEKKIEILNHLCGTIDPYQPLSAKTKMELSKLNIDSNLDPFSLTNKLVQILEDTVEEFINRGGKP